MSIQLWSGSHLLVVVCCKKGGLKACRIKMLVFRLRCSNHLTMGTTRIYLSYCVSLPVRGKPVDEVTEDFNGGTMLQLNYTRNTQCIRMPRAVGMYPSGSEKVSRLGARTPRLSLVVLRLGTRLSLTHLKCAYIHRYIHTYIHACMHDMHACIHACMHTYIHTV